MIYLLTQMFLCLVLAGVAGGAVGWLLHRARASRDDEALRETIVRQHHQLRHAETDVAMLTDDFDDLKQRSQSEIESLRGEVRRLPTLVQNLDKSQTLVRQLMQKHEAQLRELGQRNDILQERLVGHEEREALLARTRSALESARNELGARAGGTSARDGDERARVAAEARAGGEAPAVAGARAGADPPEVVEEPVAAEAPIAPEAPLALDGRAAPEAPRGGPAVGVDDASPPPLAELPAAAEDAATAAVAGAAPDPGVVMRPVVRRVGAPTAIHVDATDPRAPDGPAAARPRSVPPDGTGSAVPGPDPADGTVGSRTAPPRVSAPFPNGGRPRTIRISAIPSDDAELPGDPTVSDAALPEPALPDAAPPDAALPGRGTSPADDVAVPPVADAFANDHDPFDREDLDDGYGGADDDHDEDDDEDLYDDGLLDDSVELMFEPVDRQDDLQRILGIGPVTEQALNRIGITSYSQIADLESHDVERIADALQIYSGRIEQDDWVGNARRQLEDVLEEL